MNFHLKCILDLSVESTLSGNQQHDKDRQEFYFTNALLSIAIVINIHKSMHADIHWPKSLIYFENRKGSTSWLCMLIYLTLRFPMHHSFCDVITSNVRMQTQEKCCYDIDLIRGLFFLMLIMFFL